MHYLFYFIYYYFWDGVADKVTHVCTTLNTSPIHLQIITPAHSFDNSLAMTPEPPRRWFKREDNSKMRRMAERMLEGKVKMVASL